MSENMDTTKLEQAVRENDNEVVHGEYDKLIREIAMQADPEAVKKLNEMISGVDFWYA